MTYDQTVTTCTATAAQHTALDARALRDVLLVAHPDADRAAIDLVVRRRQARDGTPCAFPGCLSVAVVTRAVPVGHVTCDLALCDACQAVAS